MHLLESCLFKVHRMGEAKDAQKQQARVSFLSERTYMRLEWDSRSGEMIRGHGSLMIRIESTTSQLQCTQAAAAAMAVTQASISLIRSSRILQ